MKIPEIESIGVQDRTNAPAVVGAAQAQALDTFSRGFEAIGKEMVRSQQQKAQADLVSRLNSIEQEIAANKTVSTQYVREKLGGSLDSLPPEIRAQVTSQGLDVNTGQIQEFDRADIPMFAVAGSIYDEQAKKALSAASQNITLGGWAKDFQNQAGEHIAQRKSKVAMEAIKDSVAHIATQDTHTALDFANAGDFANARNTISTSKAMDADHKDKLNNQIDKLEEIRPVYEALQRDDYGSMAVFLGKLNDPKEFTKLTPEERNQFTDRLKAEIKQFQESVRKENDRLLKANSEQGWNGIFAKVRTGMPISYRDIPPPGMIPADEQKAMIEYIDNKKKGVEVKTDLALYDALTRTARTDPEAFAQVPLTSLINRLSPADFKHFSDLQAHPPGAASYDDFVNTDEAIEMKLPKQLGKSEIKDNSDKQVMVGQVKQIVQHELAGLGHRASLKERDDIIDKVIKDNVKIDPHWYGDKVKVDTSVPPKYVVALRRVSNDLGFGASSEGIRRTYEDFSHYENGISTAWGPQARGQRLSVDHSLGVYGYLKSHLGEIDAELRRVGKFSGKDEIDNPLRAALAVQGYLMENH